MATFIDKRRHCPSELEHGRSNLVDISRAMDAGVVRVGNPRTIRRYCQRGSLTCTRIDTPNNLDQYIIERTSITKRIEALRQIYAGIEGVQTDPAMSGLGRPRPDKTSQLSALNDEFVEILKTQVTEKDRQLDVKDQQISSLNKTIDAMIDRDQETNILIKGLQDKIFGIDAPRLRQPMSEGEEKPTASHGLGVETQL